LEISVDAIRALREETGAGIMDCKRALEQADGDLDRARGLLRESGLSAAVKKAGRATNEGLIETYVHSGGRLGAIVEINCETDFVARTDDFKSLAHEVAMQVAAMGPEYVDEADIPDDLTVDPEQACLMRQAYIRDNSRTIRDLMNEAVGKLGENLKVRRFVRFNLGE